jgi:hypothetical protein
MHESLRQMLRLDAGGDSPRVMGFSFGMDGHGRSIGRDHLRAFHRDKTAHWAGCLSTIPDGRVDALMFRNRPQGRLVSA